MTSVELLQDYKFVGSLNPDEKQLIVSNMTKVSYSRGERVIKNGEFVTHAVFIIKGFLKIHCDYKRKTVIMDINGPNSFSGLASMIGMDKHAFDISSIDDSTIYLINIDILRKLIEKNGLFARQLVNYMNLNMLHHFEHNLNTSTQSNIHGRLANIIIYLAQNVFCSPSFDLLLSRKELSQFSNISRENVIKVLYEFDADGLIKLNGQQIHVLNPEQLKHLAKTC